MKSDRDKKAKLTIGRLAEAAGVGVATVRYYQGRGLLCQPERPQYGGFRVYGEQDLERLLQIKRAQELGFTLAEISELLMHLDQQNYDAIKTLSRDKLQAISVRISQMEKVRDVLAALAADCSEKCLGDCALVRKLNAVRTR